MESAVDLTPECPAAGTRCLIDGVERVFYDGYWIRTYPVPEDTLAHKKRLIDTLTRRLFNHTEYGIDVPGHRLPEVQAAYDAETDPARKRVLGAMTAGALFNRAADLLRELVAHQLAGIDLELPNERLRECGRCLQSAYSLCRLVQHRSGDESIDELWGEPFRAFSVPLEEYYEARYIKMAAAMRDIDTIAGALIRHLGLADGFIGLDVAVAELANAARIKTETLRLDPNLFSVWADFVTASERLAAVPAAPQPLNDANTLRRADQARQLLEDGRELMTYIARARVSMPKSTDEFVRRCEAFSADRSPAWHQMECASQSGEHRRN